MLGQLGESDRFRLVLGCLGKSAELDEAHDQPDAGEDRWRDSQTKIFVGPFRGKRGEVLGGNLDYVLVIAPVVVRLLEAARCDNAKPRVPSPRRDLHSTGAGHEGLVQLVKC